MSIQLFLFFHLDCLSIQLYIPTYVLVLFGAVLFDLILALSIDPITAASTPSHCVRIYRIPTRLGLRHDCRSWLPGSYHRVTDTPEHHTKHDSVDFTTDIPTVHRWMAEYHAQSSYRVHRFSVIIEHISFFLQYIPTAFAWPPPAQGKSVASACPFTWGEGRH